MAGPLNVLMVEDSDDDSCLMTLELRRAGFVPIVRRVETKAAMEAALDEQPWDVVLADYHLPRFSGPEALTLVQEKGLDVPFIVVSGVIGEETAVAMMKSGAHDFVLKDRLARLGAAVSRETAEAASRRRRRWADAALEMLADAGRLVGGVPDFKEVLERAAQIPVPRLADICIVYHAREGGELTDNVAFAAREGIDRKAFEELARGNGQGLGPLDPLFSDAIRTRRPTLARSDQEHAPHAEVLRELDLESVIVVPEVAHDRVTGLLAFASRPPRRFDSADLELAGEIARWLSLILENMKLVCAREEFLSTAIHEIKTPIAVIKTAVQLLQRLPESERERRLADTLARLDRQANRLTRLVTEVLELFRLDLRRLTLARRPTDFAALVARSVGAMQGVSDRHELVVRRNDAVTAEIDADRIEAVLTNLVDNAIKYSPAGGVIEIDSRREGDSVVVTVLDHGIGIPAERRERIFERFYRAHAGTPYEHASSLGVGLYLSNQFVSRHGGQMWFESKEREGSAFSFRLPISAEGVA